MDWIGLEMKHRTSKTCSEEFWDLAKSAFHKLHRARIDDMIFKPIPKLRSQRDKLNNDRVPDINMKIGYKKKETDDEIVIVEGDKTPHKKYNPREYQKLFEVASVQVIIIYDMSDSL